MSYQELIDEYIEAIEDDTREVLLRKVSKNTCHAHKVKAKEFEGMLISLVNAICDMGLDADSSYIGNSNIKTEYFDKLYASAQRIGAIWKYQGNWSDELIMEIRNEKKD